MPIIKVNPDSYEQVEFLDDTHLKVFVSRYSGVLLYLDYDKGDEDELIFTFLVNDKDDPTSNYYYLTERDFSVKTADLFKVRVLNTGLWQIPIPVGASSDYLIVEAEFLNTSGSPGDANIYARVETAYSS